MNIYDLDECFLARRQKCMSAPKGWRTFLKFDECKGIENKCKFQIICPKNSELPDIPIFRLVTYSFPCRCDTSKTRLFFLSISIAAPSFRWTIDGVTMEYRWSILGLKRELLGRNKGFAYILLFIISVQDWARKIPHGQGKKTWWCGKTQVMDRETFLLLFLRYGYFESVGHNFFSFNFFISFFVSSPLIPSDVSNEKL